MILHQISGSGKPGAESLKEDSESEANIVNKIAIRILGVLALALAGCNRGQVPSVEAAASGNATNAATQTSQDGSGPLSVRSGPTEVLAPGTTVRVRLQETIDTKRNRAGDRFNATLDEPLVVGDRVVVPRGTRFEGHVLVSNESGRFKGRAALALSLDSFALNGATYNVDTNRATRVSRGHKKRNWLWIGGGSGAGAAIGAVASGGAGALIGAGAGAAAGTVGAAFTGKRNVSLPVESRVTFTLRAPVALGT